MTSKPEPPGDRPTALTLIRRQAPRVIVGGALAGATAGMVIGAAVGATAGLAGVLTWAAARESYDRWKGFRGR